jgi:hypothetical protein
MNGFTIINFSWNLFVLNLIESELCIKLIYKSNILRYGSQRGCYWQLNLKARVIENESSEIIKLSLI